MRNEQPRWITNTTLLLTPLKSKIKFGLFIARWRLLAIRGRMMEAIWTMTTTEVNWVGYVKTSRGPPRIVTRVIARKVSLNRSTKLAKILAMVKRVEMSSLIHSVAMILSCIQVIHLLQNKVSKQLIILSVNPGIFDSTIGNTRAGSRY